MSATQTPILQAKKRAWNYENTDGLSTIVDGLGWLLVAGFFSYAIRTHHGVLVLCGLALSLLLGFSEGSIIQKLKVRITYPRTGYVEPPAETQSLQENSKLNFVWNVLRLLLLISAAWLGSEAAFGGSRRPGWFLLIIAGMGCLKQVRRNKLAWIDLLALFLSGITIAVLPLERDSRMIFLFLTPGIVYTTRGTITFLVYLCRNPVAQP